MHHIIYVSLYMYAKYLYFMQQLTLCHVLFYTIYPPSTLTDTKNSRCRPRHLKYVDFCRIREQSDRFMCLKNNRFTANARPMSLNAYEHKSLRVSKERLFLEKRHNDALKQ